MKSAHTHPLATFFLMTGLLFATAIGFSTSKANAPTTPNTRPWSFTLGAVTLVSPRFIGSKKMRFLAVPFVDLTWRKRLFLSVYRGIGGFLWNNKKYGQGGAAINLQYTGLNTPRSNAGLPKQKIYPVLNLFLNPRWRFLILDIKYLQDVSNQKNGSQLQLGGAIAVPLSLKHKLFITLGPTATIANKTYMASRYSVSPSESAQIHQPVHNVSGGLERVGGTATIICLNERIFFNVFYTLARLEGSAASSPLIQSKWNSTTGLVLGYRWRF